MGINKRALGAALTSVGEGLEKSRLEREELRRRKEAEAKEERRLQIAEQDAAQRREMNRIKLAMENVKYSNEQIKRAVVGSGFDPMVAGKAFTDHANDGLVYTFNPTKSVPNEDGTYSKIVYDMGTYEKKGAGVSGVGGTPTVKQLGKEGMEKVFETRKDEQGNMVSATGWLTRFTSDMVNPDRALARHEEKLTGEIRQQQVLDMEAARARLQEGTAQGGRAAREQELDIKLKQKKLDQAPGDDNKEGSEIFGFKGEKVNISKEKSQTLRTALPIVAKKYSDVNTDNDVWKIDQVRNNKAIRDKMNSNIALALSGEISDAELVSGAQKELGISGEFVQELINTARANQEAWEDDLESKTPNLLQKTINKILGTSLGTGK